MTKAIRHTKKESTHKNLRDAFRAVWADFQKQWNECGSLPAANFRNTSFVLPSGTTLSFMDAHDIAQPLHWIPTHGAKSQLLAA